MEAPDTRKLRDVFVVLTEKQKWIGINNINRVDKSEGELQLHDAVYSLLRSESHYLQLLSVTVNSFLVPIRSKGIISKHEIESIFSNIETIYSLHTKIANNSDFKNQDKASLPLSFLKQIRKSSKTLYCTYCSNLMNCRMALTRSIEENVKLKSFLEDLKRSGIQLDLYSLLLKPRERLFSYPNQLSLVLRFTPESHESYPKLLKTIQKLEDIIETVKRREQQTLQSFKIKELKSRADSTTNHKILQESRELVKEGMVTVQDEVAKSSSKLFLFNDMLILSKPNTKDIQIAVSIPLEVLQVTPIAKDAVEITDTKQHKSLKLVFSEEERDSWLYSFKIQKIILQQEDIHSLFSVENATDILLHLFQALIHREFDPKFISKWMPSKNGDGIPLLHRCISTHNKLTEAILDVYKKYSNVLDINVVDGAGTSALHAMLANSAIQPQLIKRLILQFPQLKLSTTYKDKDHPLHTFAQYFASPEYCKEIGNLLLRKAGKQMINVKNEASDTPLFKAIFNKNIRLLMVEYLINLGANVNHLNAYKLGPLHLAVTLGRLDVITALICAGADMNQKGKDNKTPVEFAAEYSSADILAQMKKIQELSAWLIKEGIAVQYVATFMKYELSLQDLSQMNDSLLDKLEIDIAGDRMKLLSACKKLKNNNTITLTPSNSSNSITSSMNTSNTSTTSSINSSNMSTSSNISAPSQSISISMTGSNPPASKSVNVKNELRVRTQDGYHYSIENYIINSQDLEFTKKLGEGRSGTVYKAIYKGQVCAAKVLWNSDNAEEFKKEFLIVSSVKSPRIVHFFGAVIEPQLMIVMELCDKGSLRDALGEKRVRFHWGQFFKMCKQICLGISCLHGWTPQIVHRDISSSNLLVTASDDVLLGDFGLSRFVTDSNAKSLLRVCGTIYFCAPEVLLESRSYSTACDVYSIGIVVWELLLRTLTGEYHRPYEEYPITNPIQFIESLRNECFRPTIPSSCPQSIQSIIRSCLQSKDSLRPSTTELYEQFSNAETEWQLHSEEWSKLSFKTIPE